MPGMEKMGTSWRVPSSHKGREAWEDVRDGDICSAS